MRRCIAPLLALAPIILFSGRLFAADEDPLMEAFALRGLKGVAVYVSLSKGAQDAGFSFDELKDLVELQLRKARIPVVPREKAVLATPCLQLDVNVFSPDGISFFFTIDVYLTELVKVERNPKLGQGRHGAITWPGSPNPITGVLGRQKLPEVKRYVNDEVDGFIGEYLRQNESK